VQRSGATFVQLTYGCANADAVGGCAPGNPDLAPPGWYMLFHSDRSLLVNSAAILFGTGG
jgi:hypothetical protein